jgi:L-iditol 2-dehydrogenase
VNLCENKSVLGVSTNGGFAQYCVSNYTGVHKIPDGVSYDQAALSEPLACATYGVQNMQIVTGDFCVIMGPGVIGLMMVQMARSRGAGTIVLTGAKGDDYRLEAGKKLGADVVINTAESSSPYYVPDLKAKIAELSGGKLADAVITPTGAVDAMEAALQISGRRSRIVYFGLPADVAVIRVPALASIFWDKTIRFSWLAPLTWPIALQALGTGLINASPLISHTIDLNDLEKGIGDVRARKGNVFKVVVHP